MMNNGNSVGIKVGQHVEVLRKRLNLTQSQLAQRFNKPRTQAWVSTVEAGKVSINVTDLIEIASILGATATDLIYANEGQENHVHIH